MKSDPETILHRHIVDAKGANPAFREAPLRKHSSKEEYRFDADVPNRLTERKRLSIKNRYSGPRRGKEGAIEKHIAVKWHIITLQEAIEHLDSEYLTNRFYVTHHGGCAILSNKDTFHQDITAAGRERKELGWVLQGVISRASFPRLLRNGKSFFTTMSPHINNQFAKNTVSGRSASSQSAL